MSGVKSAPARCCHGHSDLERVRDEPTEDAYASGVASAFSFNIEM